MAKIPVFFRSTFPVETYGAMYDPAAMAVAASAQADLELNKLKNSNQLIDIYFQNKLNLATTQPAQGYKSVRFGKSAMNAITQSSVAPHEIDQSKREAADNKMAAYEDAKAKQLLEDTPNRPAPRAKTYKVPGK